MKSNCCLLCIVLTALCLTGCYSIDEVDTKAYPIAVAIDKVGEKIELGVQFGKVIKGSEGATPTEEGNIVIKYEGNSFYDAFEKLNDSTSKQLSYAQLKVLIVSEDFARDGIMPLIYSLVNSYNVYPNLYVMVSAGSAVNYLDRQKIWLETTPSKFYELFYDKAYRSVLNVMTISEIAFSQVSQKEELVLPYITYVQETEKQEQSEENVPLEQQAQLVENQVQSITPSKSEITRLAIFRDGKMMDSIEGEDVVAYGLIKGHYFKTNFSVPLNDEASKVLNIYVQNKVHPVKKVRIMDGVPHISVQLKLDVTKLSAVDSPEYILDTEKAEIAIEQYVAKIGTEFLLRTVQEYNSDIFGFGEYARSCFQTYQQMEAYQWKEHYHQAIFDIHVDAEIYTNYEVIRPQVEKP